MRVKYASFLPDLATRADLNRLLEWLLSELQVSHHNVTGGDLPDTDATLKMGLLGADYTVEDGRYRIVRIYRAPGWIPSLRSPLTEPGVDVREGDYLLAVNGRPLDPATNVFRAFENTAGAVTQLTVGTRPRRRRGSNRDGGTHQGRDGTAHAGSGGAEPRPRDRGRRWSRGLRLPS